VPYPTFMFGAPGLVFGYTEGGGSNFHVLCRQTHNTQSYFKIMYYINLYYNHYMLEPLEH
jgi:hypothetical protein